MVDIFKIIDDLEYKTLSEEGVRVDELLEQIEDIMDSGLSEKVVNECRALMGFIACTEGIPSRILSEAKVYFDKNKTKRFRKMGVFSQVSEECYLKSDEMGCDVGNTYNNIKHPLAKTADSAGYDFFSPKDFVLNPNEVCVLATGIRCLMKQNTVLLLYPRSSLGCNYGIELSNTVGVVDSGYYFSDNEGHIILHLKNTGNKPLTVKAGDSVAQGIFNEFGVDGSQRTGIRNGGHGSTGR
jgi:dUTP pyrophosphatase